MPQGSGVKILSKKQALIPRLWKQKDVGTDCGSSMSRSLFGYELLIHEPQRHQTATTDRERGEKMVGGGGDETDERL